MSRIKIFRTEAIKHAQQRLIKEHCATIEMCQVIAGVEAAMHLQAEHEWATARAAAPSDVVAALRLYVNGHDFDCPTMAPPHEAACTCPFRDAYELAAKALSAAPTAPVQPDVVAALVSCARELHVMHSGTGDFGNCSDGVCKQAAIALFAVATTPEPTVPLGGERVPVRYVRAFKEWLDYHHPYTFAVGITPVLDRLITEARKEE